MQYKTFMSKPTAWLLAGLLLFSACGQAAPASSESSVSSSASSAASSAEADAASTTESVAENSLRALPAEEVPPRIAALKGPTAMGLVKLLHDAESGAPTKDETSAAESDAAAAPTTAVIAPNAEIVSAPDEIIPKVIKKEVDLACVPANLAAVLYNKTEGKIQVLAINTLGVLYLTENGDTVHSFADLRGKTIYASGQGATPEYVLRYLLSENGLDPDTDVTISWQSEHSAALQALLQDETAVALLPQPFVTAAQEKAENLRIAVDLNEAWNALQAKTTAPSTLITGVLIGQREYIEKNPHAVQNFLQTYHASIDYVNAHPADAAALIDAYDIVPQTVAEKALPLCNITYIDGTPMKEGLAAYLHVLFEQNPKAVGGSEPDDAFYYEP